MEFSATVLDKAVVSDLIKKIGQSEKCEVYAYKISQGGNRAHVFTDVNMGVLRVKDLCDQCTMWLEELLLAVSIIPQCKLLIHDMFKFVKQEEGHLTKFMRNHLDFDRKTSRATCASAYTIPLSDTEFIYALLYAVNHSGNYTDRAYVTQMFPGPVFKAHLEIDHNPFSSTVLDKIVMSALITKIGQKYRCEVSAFKSDQGGNRAHVFTDRLVTGQEMASMRAECSKWLKESIPDLESYLALDDSTSMTRVIRAPFARSAKTRRGDQYQPWLIYTPKTNTVSDVEDMKTTIGDWISKASMRV
ncbi:hypothetical protein T492DRAFT_879313 [Pavlovales sp. CCMP2436]|nr:hypothetical protein T492DRAFT_879313 [Pavlovales sp. CCMP2436]